MKTARRCLARTLYVAIYIVAVFIGIVFVIFDVSFEFCKRMLDDLEAVIHE